MALVATNCVDAAASLAVAPVCAIDALVNVLAAEATKSGRVPARPRHVAL